MNELDRVQRWMQSVVSHPDGVLEGADAEEARSLIAAGSSDLESVVTRSKKLSAAERLAIYGNAYYSRLLDCLGEVYPVLKRTLGDELFSDFGFGYLQHYPSQSYTLHHLGEHFVGYLRDSRPRDSDSRDWTDFLIDLARLEWAIYEIFDGPGLEQAPAFDQPDLLQLGRSDWLALKIRTAPCLRLLTVDYPVNEHYSTVRSTEEAIELAFPCARRQHLALTRRDYIVRRYELNAAQFALLSALQQGLPLGDALESCIDTLDADQQANLETDLPQWFRNWSAEGCFFSSIEAGDEP